mmetsp:Transcript_1954/g.5401  ORF Transcript_1954/g.5401 Transcript_1954/m.5401 type:complete len:220 (+) Transcript_1954:677-1336(+)
MPRLLVDGAHVLDEVHHSVGVAPLVVVPGHQLDKVGRQANASLGVEDGALTVADEVGRDDVLVGVAEDSLPAGSSRSGLQDCLDFLVRGSLLQAASKVHDRDVGGGYTERHAGQLAVEGRNDLADSLGSPGGGRDDVEASAAATAPVLAGRTIDGLLGSSHGVHGGHEALDNAEVLVEDAREGCKAVRRARGVGNDVHRRLVVCVVHTHDKHGGVSGRR